MKARYWVGIIALALGIGTILIYRHLRVQSPAVESHSPPMMPSVASFITTEQPSRRTFTVRAPWIGTVESQSSVELTALVGGRVEAIEVGDQMPVQAGKVIVRLGGPQIEAQRSQLRAQVESLKSQLEIADQIVERHQGDLEEHLVTKDQLAAAQETQLQLQGQLRDAQSALVSFQKKIALTAPITGVFTNRRVSAGQTVTEGDTISEIIDTSHLRIVAGLFPPDGVTLEGRNASVEIGEGLNLSATVKHTLPETGSTGETIVWIEGEEIDQRLRPGQTVTGDVTIESNRSSLAVPESAVVYDSEEHPFIFVLKGNTYERLSVHLGITEDGWIEVLAGLEPNQSVVTHGAYELFHTQFNEQFKVQD